MFLRIPDRHQARRVVSEHRVLSAVNFTKLLKMTPVCRPVFSAHKDLRAVIRAGPSKGPGVWTGDVPLWASGTDGRGERSHAGRIGP